MEEKEEYKIYRTFYSVIEAEPFLELLKENNIDYRVQNYNSNIGSTFASTNNPNQLEVLLQPEQFEVVSTLLENDAKNMLNSISSDYYLFSFSDNELVDVLQSPDEWSKQDYILARQLLTKRGKVFSDEELQKMKLERLNEQRKPEKNSRLWMIAGFISAFLGGLLGIYIGWSIMSSMKTLSNGESVYQYDLKDRKLGRTMFIIGITSFLGWLLVFIINHLR